MAGSDSPGDRGRIAFEFSDVGAKTWGWRAPCFAAVMFALLSLIAASPRATWASGPPPVAAYSFDEGTGSVAHDSEGSNDATIEGAEWVTGKFGSGLAFDAAKKDFLTVPQSKDLQLEDFTLEAWVKPSESRAFAPVVARWNTEDYGYALYAGGEIAGLPEGFVTNQGFVDSYAYSPSTLTVNSWAHLAVTSDGKNIRFYVNGTLVNTGESSEVKAGEGPMEIGGSDFFEENEYFDGLIDELRIYGRALSAEEISEDSEQPIAHVTMLPEVIEESMTLTAKGGPYVGGPVQIEGGAALILQPGTVVKMSDRMVVNGTLRSEGTAKDPVYLTSSRNDTLGGDTNHDESLTVPEPGDWGGIEFHGGTSNSVVRHTVVTYGGREQALVSVECVCMGNLELANSTFRQSDEAGISMTDSDATVINNTVRENTGVGVSITGESAPEIRGNTISENQRGIAFDVFSEDHASVNITENHVEDNVEDGIDVDASTAFTHIDAASLAENVIKGNGEKGISYAAFPGSAVLAGSPVPADITTNVLAGNGENGIWLSGRVEEDQTWEDPGYSLVVAGNSVDVAEDATLTLDAGMTLKSAASNFYVEGTLSSLGTSEDPVIFTSAKDDTVAGDTNGDGESTQAEPGDWTGLKFPQGTGGPGPSVLEHTIVSYGGKKSFPFDSMVEVHCPCVSDPEFIDSTFSHSRRAGIDLTDSGAKILNGAIEDNAETGIGVTGEGAPEIRGNTISENSRGIVFDVFSEDHASVNITENHVVDNAEDGIDVDASTFFNHIESASLGSNQVEGNGGKGISYTAFPGGGGLAGSPVPADITTNALAGNGENGIWLSGQVQEDQTWEDPGYSLVLAGNGVDVAEGATLTLDAGLTVKAEGIGLQLEGDMDPQGTAEVPVAFTSINDDSLAGDTNGDGSATEPEAGDWTGIVVPKASGLSVSYLDMRYAEAAFRIEVLDVMAVSRSDFVYNTASIEIESTMENEPGLGSLPCTPPYLSFAVMNEDWFGAVGLPGTSIAIASLVGVAVPEKYAPLFAGIGETAVSTAELYGLDNTIPFTVYSCPAIGIPPIAFTPVLLKDVPPLGPWFPDPEYPLE